jgi:hypothetical protein
MKQYYAIQYLYTRDVTRDLTAKREGFWVRYLQGLPQVVSVQCGEVWETMEKEALPTIYWPECR